MSARVATWILVLVAVCAGTSAATCLLDVDGVTHEFDGCAPLQDPRFQLFYTVEPGAKGGSLMKGGIKVPTASNSFAGWGWCLGAGNRMNNSDVVILNPAGDGVAIGGYKLRSYANFEVNAANGTLDIGPSPSAGRTSDGFWSGVFEMELPESPEVLATTFKTYIYVFNGALSADGALNGHPGTLSSKAINVVKLAPGTGGAPAPAPAPVLEQVAAPAPAPAVEASPPPSPAVVLPPEVVPLPVVPAANTTSGAAAAAARVAALAASLLALLM